MRVDFAILVTRLAPMLKRLRDDLDARSEDPSALAAMRAAWNEARREDRTAEAFPLWRERLCERFAIAWILSCVFVRTLEDRDVIADVLGWSRSHAVVGNPPDITAKDAKLRGRYREDDVSVSGKLALAVTFTERFFQLAKRGSGRGGRQRGR